MWFCSGSANTRDILCCLLWHVSPGNHHSLHTRAILEPLCSSSLQQQRSVVNQAFLEPLTPPWEAYNNASQPISARMLIRSKIYPHYAYSSPFTFTEMISWPICLVSSKYLFATRTSRYVSGRQRRVMFRSQVGAPVVNASTSLA
jgi:hypothetical protein